MSHDAGRPVRRVVEARRPGHDTFCNILLLQEERGVAMLVHALDDLRIEFDERALTALVDALARFRDGLRERDGPRRDGE